MSRRPHYLKHLIQHLIFYSAFSVTFGTNAFKVFACTKLYFSGISLKTLWIVWQFMFCLFSRLARHCKRKYVHSSLYRPLILITPFNIHKEKIAFDSNDISRSSECFRFNWSLILKTEPSRDNRYFLLYTLFVE